MLFFFVFFCVWKQLIDAQNRGRYSRDEESHLLFVNISDFDFHLAFG